MATIPVYNPTVPFLCAIPGGLPVGTKLHIHGTVVNDGENGFFPINLQSGTAIDPRADTPLHVSIRVRLGEVVLNTFEGGAWQQAEWNSRGCPVEFDVPFQMIIEVQEEQYSISMNGEDLDTFPHRLPPESVRFVHVGHGGTIQSITDSRATQQATCVCQ